jgi:hypothetical protein
VIDSFFLFQFAEKCLDSAVSDGLDFVESQRDFTGISTLFFPQYLHDSELNAAESHVR